MPDRPNILLIHVDQHRYDCLGLHGHPFIQTPHLDRLGREGATFSHAFSPVAVCTPARACLLTGAWATTHRSLGIPSCEVYQPARRELPILWTLLRDAGYRQALVGKYHGEVEGTPPDWGVDEFVPEWGYGKWREEQGLPPAPNTNGFAGDWDPGITPDQTRIAWGARTAADCVRRFHAEGRPFFVRWDPSEPHLPCRPSAELRDLYPAESIPPWPSFPDPLDNKPSVQARQKTIWGTTDWTWEQWQPIVSRYLAEITTIDAQVGRLLALLDELGAAENTLVLYSTDHGDFCGGHGFFDKHFSCYDDIQRVPLLARWPGQIAAGTVCDAFVSNEIDLARTIAGRATGTVPGTFAGADLVDTVTHGNGRSDIFAQYFGTESGLHSARMVRDRHWKYVWHATGGDELYHLDVDPGEIRNLAGNDASAGELARLRQRLAAWMTEVRDPLLNLWTRPLLGV